jgi:hypothetical protein
VDTNSVEVVSTPSSGCGGEQLVSNHVLCIPKDLCGLIAIEDEYGRIIPMGGDITDLKSTTKRSQIRPTDDGRPSVFQMGVTHGNTTPIFGEDLEQLPIASSNANYYKISGNYIQFSFEEGFVKLHYLRRPLDKEGYPLIPDNENFKQALYWYVLKQLIGAGYKHQVFDYGKCDEEFEKYGARAINEITYPSLDAMAKANRSLIRLIPPYHFYEDFFANSEQTQQIRK